MYTLEKRKIFQFNTNTNIFLQVTCQPGFTEYGGRCYRYFKGKIMDKHGNFTDSANAKSWRLAKKQCWALTDRHLVHDLVSVHSREENDFLVSLINGDNPELNRYHYNFPWIGLYSKHADNWTNAKWTDGTTYDYKYWGKGEPSETKVLVQY